MFCEEAADALHLKYLHEHACPWNEGTCSYAARDGHLECLKYAHENGCPWDEKTCSDAAFRHLGSLKYAYQNRCPGYEKYHNKIKHLLLMKNMEVYYKNCLIVRKVLKMYITDFKERYYSPNGIGFFKRKEHFHQLF